MAQNLPFNVDALLVFAKVVECRSLSQAAALLAMPKSTVSRQISRLEADLGTRLLRRNTHRISVTDLGQQVYSHALKILAEANDIRALVEGSQQEPQGELRAAIPVFVGIDYATRVGAAFLQRYPRSRLEIRMVDSVAHPVKDGYDAVFATGPLQDSTLIARKVFTLELLLCASREFLAGLAEPIAAPAQLNLLPFIEADYYGGRHKLLLSRGGRQVELSPPVRARANSFQMAKQYIAQGLGVGLVPRLSMGPGEWREGIIVPVLEEWRPQSLDLYLIYPFQLSFSTLISAFYDTALEAITQSPRRAEQGL